jgi:sodium/potassium-transporting ATPase subunit alpha
VIHEILIPERIVLDARGPLSRLCGELLRRSSFSTRREELDSALSAEREGGYLFIAPHIAVPHLQLEGLELPELLLAVSRRGIEIGGHRVHLLGLLASPSSEPAAHLQLLQRLSSVLPAVYRDLLSTRDPQEVVRRLAREEKLPGRASFLNVTQDQVAFELRTELDRGLDSEEAVRRLRIHGPNRLRKGRKTPWYVKLSRNLFGLFAVLLWAAALLSFLPAVGMPELGLAILIVILVNGFFAFVQEHRTDRALEMLQRLLSLRSRVVRDGVMKEIDAATLVPGDVILLEPGDIVPADARLIEAFDVEVDNSTLTGESTSARRYKSDAPVLLDGKFLWIELPNIVFAGTSLVRGQARAVVFGTGMRSEVGKIATLTQQIPFEQSPLQRQLRQTVSTIALLASVVGLGFLLLGWLLTELTFAQAFVFCIGLFVANVPEGLLPTVTLSLAMAVTRMARKNALVKRLPSVETLGSTTVICSDKTGTLTENQMTVLEIHVDGRVVSVSGAGYRPVGTFRIEENEVSPEELLRVESVVRLLECATICNNARIERVGSDSGSDSDYRCLGDATEGALMALAEKAGLRVVHERKAVIPFDSIRKRMSVVAKVEGSPTEAVFVKGAPLELLERCGRVSWNGEQVELDDERRGAIRSRVDSLAERGLRVLGLAFRDGVPASGDRYEADEVESDLVFAGLAAMSDPVRPSVRDAILSCHRAGIRVIMITGDYPLTAAAIARQIGIEASTATIFTGAQVAEMSDAALGEAVARGEPIFARVSPEHKLRIVSVLREAGEVVAVTGDGVNDAPALKKADIGIAMGLRGNDVAKEAADMILLDDDFRTIVAAIEEGRAVFENIQKFMAYIFNSNPQEMYPYVLWMLVPGVPLAMTVMGVLAVDVGTDLVPAIGLGAEPPEPGLMDRPPRRREERLLSLRLVLRSYFVHGTLLAFSCFATYFYMGHLLGAFDGGFSLRSMPASPPGLDMKRASVAYLQTLTAFFFPTVAVQIANVLSKRSRKTSLFSREFLTPERRRQISTRLASPRKGIAGAILRRMGETFDAHPIWLNFLSNPIILAGIVSELGLCGLLFYTPLAKVYFFAPVPWHVYLFAFHGTALLLLFEETKKWFRRRGYPLELLG